MIIKFRQEKGTTLFPACSPLCSGGGLEDFVGDFDLEAGPCIEPGEDLGDASLFARRLDFLAVVENELG